MKSAIKYIPLFIALLPYSSCTETTSVFDIEMAIVVDKTDRMSIYPTADEIISQLELKDNPWQGVRITATYISDRDVNDVTVLQLDAENEWSGNMMIRKAKIKHFVKGLQECLSAMKYSGTCPYSIVYRTVARQANRLAASNSNKKFLLIYSDLYENTADMSFYDPKIITRLQQHPQSIEAQFEATVPLGSLSGLNVWLIYNPANYRENSAYMAIANFYQRLFTEHGAVTHIANKFMPL